ncbi:MAG: hypothetical protein IJP52_04275 [Paludibacteraceae bacterium]|nr:hypothetical protein [Paludibacteraceae bacterium]
MKRLLYLTVVLLMASMSVSTVQANDYLEQKGHYTVMNMGNGVYRFYVPVWVYGHANNYCLRSSDGHDSSTDSYVWYSLKKDATKGSSDVHRIATVRATFEGKNKKNDYEGEGEGFIYVHEGSIVIQSMFSGEKLALQAGDDTYYKTSNPLILKRKNDDSHEDITYITFDWYVPQALANGVDFYFGVSANIYNCYYQQSYYQKWWTNNEKQNVSYPQTPELFTPYLYAVDGEGASGYGNAAVQYTVFQEPVSYHTSLNATEMPCDKKADMIIVPTTDSVQRFFSATFRVDMTQDSALQRYTVKSNEIHIPAYHRIYDFRAEEILDAQKSVTGDVQLSWGIRCPGAQDLVSTDMFEIERAFKPDFSDALTIAIENFSADSGTYTIPDNPLEAMRALDDTTLSYASHFSESQTFTVTNADGDQVEYEATLSSNTIYEPGRPVYYRIRRATSAIWGWVEGFSQSTTLNKNNYLAPLAQTQAPYTKDADYETNRKVHFNIKIENQSIHLEPEAEEQCVLQSTVKQIRRFVPITLHFSGLDGVNPKNYDYKFIYLPPEGALQSTYMPLNSDNTVKLYAESGSKAQLSVVSREYNKRYTVYVVDLVNKFDNRAAYDANVQLYPSTDGFNLYAHITENEEAMQTAYEEFIAQNPVPDTVRHTLYTKLESKVARVNESETRCNWDRNAIIYLQRILVETGDTIELPVPADSVIRQADGSWMAHMTDVADRSCMHYKYAVRIDQKVSALKMHHPTDLQPVAIDGPDLYYNEVAEIDRFEATQGTDRYSIILTWAPTAGSVDNYELARREAGSTDDYRVLLTTDKYGFRDDSVTPGKEYQYRIIASYTCNDTTTTHGAITTGSRSPYGLISGRIHYADGTGCPGVKVAVTGEGLPVTGLTTLTDGAGRYMFDSLLYGEGKTYSIIPTSTYAEFRWNNTNATTASVTLDAGNPVAEAVEFDNISSVRLSGRMLYSKSSIPVRDANLLLDGVMIQRAGGPLKTDASGNFEIQVPLNHQFTLQAVKEGHTFEGDGFVRMNNDSNLVLDKPLDGVRIWDATKVRLAGRVVGGLEQAGRALGFGLSVNYLGDDVQLVLELEGDNISHIVRDENDLTRDTFEYTVPHLVYGVNDETDTVGTTQMHYQKKRIIINPDPLTGEYSADLFPVKYKITQATARGYATLFAEGKTSEVIDLSDAATHQSGDILDGKAVKWNEKYSITYRSPIDITCTQLRYGIAEPYLGEKSMTRQNIKNEMVEIPLVEKDSTGVWHYTFGHPVFATGDYTFRINAHEDYYYNNDKTSTKHERVPINGGDMKIYNGLHASEETQTLSSLFPKWEQATQRLLGLGAQLNEAGQIDITIPVDYVSFNKTGDQALRVLDVAIELEGRHIEKQVISAYVTGNRFKGNDYAMAVDAGVTLLDVLRDPPGSKSYAYLESGTTFTYNYNWTVNLELGIELDMSYGTGMGMVYGVYMGTAPATPAAYSGNTYSSLISNSWSLPLKSGLTWKHGGSYTFTTTERIETASDDWFVGSRGDIYIGLAQSAVFQMLDAVKPLDSLTYVSLSAQLKDSVGVTGSSATVAEGHGLDGQKYYLAIGEEIAGGHKVDGTFAYSQDYILTVLLPQLIERRDQLLVMGDSATIQSIADARQEPVYWSHVLPTDTTFALSNYEVVYPTGVTPWMKVNQVEMYNNTIASWLNLIEDNEKEKLTVMAGVNADLVKNYFVSNGVKLSYSETYNAVENHSFKIDGLGFDPSTALTTLSPDGKALKTAQAALQVWREARRNSKAKNGQRASVQTKTPTASLSWNVNPLFDLNWDRDPNWSENHSRTAGFVLEPDEYSYMNVSVLRYKEEDNEFNKTTYDVRETVDDGNDYDGYSHLYGSFIYKLNGGATKCPWEGPEESIFYTQGGRQAQLSDGTLKLENPKIDIIHHEISDVPRDQPAIINVRLSNETQQSFENYVVFKLVLVDASNPNGAKVLMDGFPLTGDGRAIKLNPGQTIDKTIEIYAGQGNDFENLTLMLASQCDILNFMKASFSVHFLPTSCDVNIAAPHDKWVMNTLSPKDSTGWYLPIVIDGYDINYPNFDHIEFQYKLSKQSDDGWVNLCSFYADSTYYKEASGSKAMMKAGRIENIAFYGERDPMEQEYDLRAVSFCRYGTSYLTKSSKVLTGIKDTRVPVVFGEPEPANSILGVGDHLKLRFNEPIAGNYLDEDNNFQITGITNTTGLSAATSLHFDGNASATTKAKRDLTETDFTIDMMIKPTIATNRANDMILFETGDGQITKQLILTKDNYLRLIKTNGKTFLGKSSKKLEDIRAFTRVLCVYKKGGGVQFYVGTEEVTSGNLGSTDNAEEAQDRSAYFRFGSTYDGDMLEARIWTKALTLEEISATANRTLTGYERELLAYYQMNEGKGETVTDQAHGATLYLDGCSWNKQKGYSLKLDGEPVQLNGNLLGRSKIYDLTMMLWFKAEKGGTLFNSNDLQLNVPEGYADGKWHHMVLTISRIYNNAALFLDGKMVQTYDATQVGGLVGTMYLGGNGFKGNIDEFVIFEQALPKSLVELYENNALTGDEMGLFAYLPFEEQYTNPNGIIEQRFSINDQRIFKDATGKVINKIVPLVSGTGNWTLENAPIKSKGVLNKLYFNWAFNNDELMINILNRDYEVNKQSIYITVRDVEDLNGNPMTSPVTWTAFVDRNSLKWSTKKLLIKADDTTDDDIVTQVDIINQSGKRHTYTIESLPSWLTISPTYGAIDPMEEQTVRLTFNSQIAVGEYSDILYLTDEDGLSEPIHVEYVVEAIPPYDNLDEGKYPYNMSICAQVKIGDEYDTDERDIVYAIYRNECVGMEHVAFDNVANKSKVYLTVHGNDEMNRQAIRFQLWQASTGKLYDLTTNVNVLFAHGFVYNCGSDQPLILTTSGSEIQAIDLSAGWNWISTYMDLTATQGALTACMTANEPWAEGDIIKNTNTRQFSTYDTNSGAFVGTLTSLHHSQMYMLNTQNGNTMRIAGEILSEDSMHVSVRGDGQWSPMPCLFDQTTALSEALAGYYQDASAGDIIKARNRFATFTENKRWEGNLTAVRPGEGYLFRRMAPGTIEIEFHKPNTSAMPKRVMGYGLEVTENPFTNPKAATNMTMIAQIEGLAISNYRLEVYVGDELAAIATPIDSLYFLTIQSDKVGELKFQGNGEWLEVIGESIPYSADAHYGTLKAPVLLRPKDKDSTGIYKIIENNHVVIIRNNEKYDVTGTKL